MKSTALLLALGLAAGLAAGPAAATPPVYQDDFQSYGSPGEPPGWFDSSPGNPQNEAAGQYKVWGDPVASGNRVFGHQGASGAFTHYRALTFSAAEGFRFTGRMWRGRTNGHLGVTFLSSFPSPNAYYLLAQSTDSGTVRLSAQGAGPFTGDVESGVSLLPEVWYRFVLEALPEGSGVRVHARVWRDGQAEPAAWSIDALDPLDATAPRASGWLGLWAEGNGHNYWDDFNATRGGGDVDHTPPQFNSITPADGTLTGAVSVTLQGQVTGATSVTVDGIAATLSGNTFTAGPLALAEGVRTFVLTAADAAGNSAQLLHRIERDSTPPALAITSPGPGQVVGESPLTVTGTAGDAHLVEVRVAGVPATLAGSSFTGHAALHEGQNSVPVLALDAVGNQTPGSITVVLDSTAPTLRILESGAALADNAVFNRAVTPVVEATDATAVHVEALLDGTPFTSGTQVTAEGEHRLEATATDAAGNTTPKSVRFTIDRTPPRFVIVAPPDGKLLADVQVTLTGTVEDAVRVTVDGTPATLAGNTWSAGPLALNEGERTFDLAAFDAAGNPTHLAHHLVRDATAPVVTITQPTAAIVSTPDVDAAGTAVDLHLTEVRINGVPANLAGQAWSGRVSLAEGENTIDVIAKDGAGNSGAAHRTVTLDTRPPVLRITEGGGDLADGAQFERPVAPVVQATDATAVTLDVKLDGHPFTSGTTVNAEGQHELAATATDAAGNSASLLRTFSIDSTPPVFLEVLPAAGTVTAAAEVTLRGKVRGAATVTVDGQPATLVGEDFTAGPFTLAEGERIFALVAADGAGNRVPLTHRIVRDATAPQVTITQPAANAVLDKKQADVVGTVRDATAVTVKVNGIRASLSGTTFIAQGVPLTEGDNSLRAVAEDAAGNSASAERAVVVDSLPPEVAITDPAAGTVVPDGTIRVAGTAADPHLDRIEVKGVRAVRNGASWSVDAVLAEGRNTLTARAYDTLGHFKEAAVEVTRDSTAPSIEITDPAEGKRIAAATVRVRGTVEAGEGITVTVNGVAATVVNGAANGTWTADGVPLAEGENRLIARATDRVGNHGSHTRTVTRDTVAPELTASEPVDGALAIAAGSTLRLTFSEAMAAPAGALRLETAAGAVLAATVTVTDTTVTVRPAQPLPSAAGVHLVLTAGLTDLAGNALAGAPRTLAFGVADGGAPEPPAVAPVPRFVCAPQLALSGSAEADALVRAVSGAATAEARADAAGAFTLTVSLLPAALNRVLITATDRSGNASEAAVVEVVHDCRPPEVVSSERAGAVFSVVFSEPLAAASVAGALTLSAADGPVAGAVTLSADGKTARFTAGAGLPADAAAVLRLEASTAVTDLAGNALAYPWSRLFGGAGGDGFLAGTVLDDATGRPFAGARVVVVISDGHTNAAPYPEQTTGPDGRFQIPLAAGTHELSVLRPGYTPSFRVATLGAGEGIDVFDPRLTPAAPPAAAASGGLPAGAAVTFLGEQGLPALLPYGWSPRGAAWIDLGGQTLATPAELALPVEAPDGTTLTLAALDLATLQWRARDTAQASGGKVVVSVTAEGAYAALEADTGALAPPATAAGSVLGSAARPAGTEGSEIIAATVTFDPEVVLPTQTSTATVAYTLAEPAPSGLPLTLSIEEELELLDGSHRGEAPYRADLVLYRAPGGGGERSRFRLRPSQAAQLLPIKLGAEDVAVQRYGGESVRGNVLGPSGGAVSTPEGDRVDVPAGALEAPAAVSLERRPQADLPLAVPAHTSFAGLLRLDFGGRHLAAPASLLLAVDPAPPAEARGLLLQVVDLGAGPFLRPVAELAPDAAGWVTKAIDDTDLAWPGVREGGLYLLVRWETAAGFFRGTVLDVGDGSGEALAGAPVTAVPGSGWTQLAGADGRYVFPAAVGLAVLEARNTATLNRVQEASEIPAADARVDLDLRIQVVAPLVVEISPADGAAGVPAGVQPTIRFSEPVSRASLAAGILLLNGGQPVPIDLDHQGALVTVEPRSTLVPGATYELRVTSAVQDLQGYQLPHPASATFTTLLVPSNSDVHLDRISLIEPDANGMAHVLGAAGAVPAGSLVFVENTSRLVDVPSVEADRDGAFTLAVRAGISDKLVLRVVLTGANTLVFNLGPFLAADRRGAAIPAGAAGSFTTVDGIKVTIAAGTFATDARVRIVPAAPGVQPAPALLHTIYAFTLDFGGAQATKPLEIELPAPAGATDKTYLLNRLVEVQGRRLWMLHDLMRLDGGRLTTALPPETSPGTSSAPALARAAADGQRLAVGKIFIPSRRWKKYVTGASFPGEYQVENPLEDIGFLVIPLSPVAGSLFAAWNLAFEGMVAVVNREIGRLLEGDGVMIPARLGRKAPVEIRDLTTGYKLFAGEIDPPTGENELLVVPPDIYGDDGTPAPVSGSPLRFYLIDLGKRLSSEIDLGLRSSYGSAQLQIDGDPGAVQPEVKVRLLGLDDDLSVFTTAGIDGSFHLAGAAAPGKRYLVAIGARVTPAEPIDIAFSEALGSVDAIEVVDALGRQVGATIDFLGTEETVRIEPIPGWHAGETYTVRLLPALADGAGNAWGKTLEVPFKVEASSVLGTYPLSQVRDIARMGSLLFVAADSRGLVVLDASDPAHLKNVIPGDLGFPFPLGDAVRGVAVDPHGRVLVVGGGVSGFGQLKIFDPLALDPAAIAADPGNPAVRYAAFKGSTIVSDPLGGTGTQLPSGTPRRVSVMSDDARWDWKAGEEPPSGIAVDPRLAPTGGGDFNLKVSGIAGAGTHGLPVTLRDLTRGRFNRVDARSDGSFDITLKVRAGDELELLANRRTLAYVATTGVGVEVVDVDAFYNEAEDPSIISSDVLGIYSGLRDPRLVLCNAQVSDFSTALTDLGTLFDAADPHPLTVAGLVGFTGMVLLESDPNDAGRMSFVNDGCAKVDGTAAVSGLAVVQHYPFDFDGDGAYAPVEYRDLALVTHRTAGLLIFDVTDRENVISLGRIRLPGQAAHLGVDRQNRRVFISGYSGGIYMVDLDLPPTLALIDGNRDGIDDRVLETIHLDGNTNSPVFLVPELGLAFAGGLDRGVTGVAVGEPLLQTVVQNADGTLRQIRKLAPFGTPTGPESFAPEAPDLSGSFRVLAHLPGMLGAETKLDVVGLGPGGMESDGLGDADLVPGLPGTALRGEHGIVLHRLADNPYEEGYQIYLSEEVAAIGEARAFRAFTRTEKEREQCVRCDIPEDAREVLSGTTLAVRFPADLRARLLPVYGASRLDGSEMELASVPWEMSPSIRQEPAQNAATGHGDVAPGTLLYSGELSHDMTDLSVRSLGLDFAFRRTYRSQTVGAGPLGPGWDFEFHQRLRELGNGDVEYYDGRGRRETFVRQGDGTFEAPAGRFVSLDQGLQRTSAGWVMITAHRQQIRFDRFGRLLAIADSVKDAPDTGNEMTFHYDLASRLVRVTDSLDRDYALEYDDQGRLETLRDFDSREVRYAYDAAGRLTGVTSPKATVGITPFPQGLTTHYGVPLAQGSPADVLTHRDDLLAITDPRGVRWLEATYGDEDADGRAQEVIRETWGSASLSIDYDFGARTAKVTNRRGFDTQYQMNPAGQTVRMEEPGELVTTSAYDGEGNLTRRTTPLGPAESFTYDTAGGQRSAGNLTASELTPGAGGRNGSAALLSAPAEHDPSTNLPTRLVDPRGGITEVQRNAGGLPEVVRRGMGTPAESVTRAGYDALGRPERITNANGHVTELRYYDSGPSKGYLRSETVDPGGLALVTTYETDGRGNVTAIVDPRGVRHEFVFNELDWLVERREPSLGLVTRYGHDGNGNLLEEQLPYGETGGSFTRNLFTYGPLNEVLTEASEITPDGETALLTRTFDENLNSVEVVQPAGQKTAMAYDARDLVEQMTHSGPGLAQPVVEQFRYDAEGRRVAAIDGRGKTSTTAFDGYGRPKESRDVLGHLHSVLYDDNGNPVDIRAYDNAGCLLARSTAAFDLLNRKTEEGAWLWQARAPGENCANVPQSARALTARIGYDGLGNVTRATDPLGRETAAVYDAAERLTETRDAAGNRVLLDPDENGNAREEKALEVMPDGSIQTVLTRHVYDPLNRRIESRDGLENTTRRRYDARGNVILTIDPEGFLTTAAYDGLDRVTRVTRPEGIELTYGYDKGSRLITVTDALANMTRWGYDALDRQTSVEYQDGAHETWQYDPAGNLVKSVDALGTEVRQTYDDLNRLLSLQVTPAPGVEGPTVESYTYDELSRPVRVQSGDVVSDRTYDSLSRVLTETTAGRTVRSVYDDAGNEIALGYPSGRVVGRQIDRLDRPQSIGPVAQLPATGGTLTVPDPVARYAFRGADLVAEKTVGAGAQPALRAVMRYDEVRRLVSSSTQGFDGKAIFGEAFTWTPRSLKATQVRADQSAALAFHYDEAGRLTGLDRTAGATGVATEPTAWSFAYDKAENLLEKKTDGPLGKTRATLPLDGSGRNRPGSVDGTALEWDKNGNLKRKGDLRLFYDFRNRLTRITGPAGEVARYTYDGFDRRIRKVAGGDTTETVWRGWQALEEYRNGVLHDRRTFGLGLDEIVQAETDLDGDGQLDHAYHPVYDETTNLVMVVDETGRPVEHYEYSPFGERRIVVNDRAPPAVEQLRRVDGALWLEMSEPVSSAVLRHALDQGQVTLTDTATGQPVAFDLAQPVQTGREAGRRVVLTLSSPPAAGASLRLALGAGALEDIFGNSTAAAFEKTFPWPAGAALLEDQTPPRVEQIAVRSGHVEVQLSEEATPATAAATILVDGAATTWRVGDDRYTLISDGTLSGGAHTVQVGTAPLDLAGLGLAQAVDSTFDLQGGEGDRLVYSAPDDDVTLASSVGNLFGFHGLPVDPETGLVYVRNRYYDPELGRFLTTDPMGYQDSPSLYSFAGNNPYAYSDPYGLCYDCIFDLDTDEFGSSFQGRGSLDRSWRFLKAEAVGFVKAPVKIVEGVAHTVTHLGETVEGLAYVATHFPEVAEHAVDSFVEGSIEQQGEVVGDALFGMFAAGAAKTEEAAKLGKLARVKAGKIVKAVAGRSTALESAAAGAAEASEAALAAEAEAAEGVEGAAQVAKSQRSTLDFLQDVAERAEKKIGGTGAVPGTDKHAYAEKLIQRYQRRFGPVGGGLETEQSYLGGVHQGRHVNLPGSVRLDVVEGPVTNPLAVYDFKFTINPNPKMSAGRLAQIYRETGFPRQVPIIVIHP